MFGLHRTSVIKLYYQAITSLRYLFRQLKNFTLAGDGRHTLESQRSQLERDNSLLEKNLYSNREDLQASMEEVDDLTRRVNAKI